VPLPDFPTGYISRNRACQHQPQSLWRTKLCAVGCRGQERALLPGTRNRKGRKAARGGASDTVRRLDMSPTIKRASRPVCQNDTPIRSPASFQNSSNQLKTKRNWMSHARNTSKDGKQGANGNPAPEGGNVFSGGRHLHPELPHLHSHVARQLCLTLPCGSIRLPSLPLCGYGN